MLPVQICLGASLSKSRLRNVCAKLVTKNCCPKFVLDIGGTGPVECLSCSGEFIFEQDSLPLTNDMVYFSFSPFKWAIFAIETCIMSTPFLILPGVFEFYMQMFPVF